MKKTKNAIVAIVAMLLCLSLGASVAESGGVQPGDTIRFGAYEQDGNAGNGKEPIEWIVLSVEDDAALVIAAQGLEAISWGKPMDMAEYTDKQLNWENSYLRQWMNGSFLTEAFSADEQADIIGEEKIFALSIDEADKYFESAAAMACSATEHAKAGLNGDSGAWDKKGNCIWWLRDMTSAAKPSTAYNFMSADYNEAAYVIWDNGTEHAKSGKGTPVFCDYLVAARPAMRIKIDSSVFAESVSTSALAEEFVLRNGILFGDTMEIVVEKETLDFPVKGAVDRLITELGEIATIPNSNISYEFDENGFLKDMNVSFRPGGSNEQKVLDYEIINKELIGKYDKPLEGTNRGSSDLVGSAIRNWARKTLLVQALETGTWDQDYDEWIIEFSEYCVKIEHVIFYTRESNGTKCYHNLSYTKFSREEIEPAQHPPAQAIEEAEAVYAPLEKGSKGDGVVRLQERLNALGYGVGKADGDYGNKTKVAIEDFQERNKLSVTGTADVETQEKLFSDAAVEAPVTRKKDTPFTIDGQEFTIKSAKFVNSYDYGQTVGNPSRGVYLCVKGTLKNTGSSPIAAKRSMYFEGTWDGKTYDAVRFPKNYNSYLPMMWAMSDESIWGGASVDMVYLIDMPKGAKNSGSVTLLFSDGTEYTVR